MSDNTLLNIAQTGIDNGLTGLKKNASQLASKDFLNADSVPSAGSSAAEGSSRAQGPTQVEDSRPISISNELVEMKINKYQVLASGKVIETVDEMLGTLIDEKA